ncbi:ATP-grasp domain-containing protein [Sedimentibacter sp. zth1]|uniref:ATP-grasp domain-containing protein n=1 Tax=Sedimentibacter sp. zth1 TaxID=2816908 RepID=UPI001A936405|nr:ATP-grasp domain-containing protein [Sedimentibacter sp. zth1]QSX05294.1 ATP-grasp domain-containing protein [Sedimentibacter sp. zth1]
MKKRIAIFPAGTEIGLEINRALKYSTHLEIYGFTSFKDHSEYVYSNYVEGLPFYSDDSFIKELNYYLEKYKIDFIFPAHDDVQLFLTENADKIKSLIITTDLKTVRVCRSKIETYNYFCNEDFVPKTYNNKRNVDLFPVFIKPDIGQGSRGAKVINNMFELENAIYENQQIVICEYLPGEEYTIDCFTDFNRNLRACKFRNRKRIKTGISVNSEILPMDEEVFQIANIINEKLKFNGAWFFQLKRDKHNKYKLLEIAPRVSGTMGLSRNTGINYSLLTIFNTMKIPVSIIENKYNIEVDRAFISRYKTDLEYDNIYLDLDDTLIENKKVNSFLMMFLYQIVNEHKKIILLTKHKEDTNATLAKHKICPDLFSEIIHIKNDDEKSEYIIRSKAIFIDDSFSERYKVAQNTGIPVFDCSEIEALIDWRV